MFDLLRSKVVVIYFKIAVTSVENLWLLQAIQKYQIVYSNKNIIKGLSFNILPQVQLFSEEYAGPMHTGWIGYIKGNQLKRNLLFTLFVSPILFSSTLVISLQLLNYLLLTNEVV